MKPVPCRPPQSTRRTQGGDDHKGGGANQTVSSGTMNSARRTVEVDRLTGNPTWMRKLEERYQKLHRKIAAIPTTNTAASRFNFLTRKFLNEHLAKANRKTKTQSIARESLTAPSTTGYKDNTQTGEDEPLPPPGDSDSSEDSDSDDVNDENLPPAGEKEEWDVSTVNGAKRDLISVSKRGSFTFYTGFYPEYSATLQPPQRLMRGASVSLDNLLPGRSQRSPLLERDDAMEENNNMARDLAPSADLAHISGLSLPPRHTGPRHSTTAGHLPPAYRQATRTDGIAGFSGREDPTTDGTEQDNGQDSGGSGWLNGNMGEFTASGLRTLFPVSAEKNKRGSLLRAAQTGSHYSITTTKSCPAILSSTELPSASRRRGGGFRLDSRAKTGNANMRVFGQMSLEARHAITETLREMGALDQTEKPKPAEMKERGFEDSDKNDHANGNVRFPSQSGCLPSLQPQSRSKLPNDAYTTQQSRDHSLTASQKTGARQRGYVAGRYPDTSSSVNATVRAAKSPRRTNKKSSSLVTGVNGRVRPKSAKTLVTTLADVGSDSMEQGQAELDLLSVQSFGNVSSNHSSPEPRQWPTHGTNLPVITSRTEPNGQSVSNNMNHVNYRIRGVGSYRVARERTFEITAPDFDIRYRDVISCQKGDRDTPPPDIFEKSVGKVRDWLNKYFFNS